MPQTTADHHANRRRPPQTTADQHASHRGPPQTTFTKHAVPARVWVTLSVERKDELFARFLADSGKHVRVKEVTSRDGALTMPTTLRVARKPGQKSRARATKTTTYKHK